MKCNGEHICRFGKVPSLNQDFLALHVPINERKENRPLKLELLKLAEGQSPDDPVPDLKVIWANKAQLEHNDDLIGNTCYRYFIFSDEPCKWCPVIKTFKDGFTHIGFATSPIKGSYPHMTYTWIISVPYAYNAKGEVSKVLEILYDYTNEEYKLFNEGLNKHRLGADLGDLIVSADSKEDVAILLLCGLLLGLPDEISEGSAFLFATNSVGYEQAEIVEHYDLLRTAIPSSIPDKIRNKEIATPSFIRGCIPARIIKEPAKKLISNWFDKYEVELLPKEGWIPTRLGNKTFGIFLPHIDDENDCLLAFRVTDNNELLFDSTLSIATLLISMFRRVLEIREKNALSQVQYNNLQRVVDGLTEGGDNLVDLLPFLLGKVHDFNLVFKLQKEVLHSIKYLEVGKEYRKVKSMLMDKVESVTQDLDWLTSSMQSVITIKAPYFRTSDIRKLISASFLPFEHKFKEDRIVYKPPRFPGNIYLECDPSLVRQVFINLADNSIKALSYIKGGQKTIEVRLKQIESGIKIDFEDNGGGIRQEIIPKIFDRFVTTRPGGIGLGLYFVKKIIEDVHHGQITVSSEWGKNTTFKIFLPFKTYS
jgi:signal transduction histidine kinase